jgi:hypothetical protein
MRIEIRQTNVLPEKITVARTIFRTKPLGYYTYEREKCNGLYHIANCDCDMDYDRNKDINLTEVEHE